MTAPFDTILYDKSCGIGHVSLNRPAQLNAYSVAMRDDFSEALRAVAEDPDVSALLITGRGRAFCAGADLSEFGTAPSQAIARSVRWQRDVWGQLIDLAKPIVAGIHGYCIGSGLEIALLSDVRVAADDTIFAMPELHLGMIPAAGGSQTLPRNALPPRALDLLLTGRRFGADEALQFGLVSRVVSPDELESTAWQLARMLARIPSADAASMRAVLRDGADLSLSRSLMYETRAAAALMGSHQPTERG